MRFVHTADNHLDMPLGSLPPHKAAMRRDMRLSSFSRIIEYTRLNGDMLFISGDLFDSPSPSPSILAFCRKEFEKLGDIPVFISLGNHDYKKTDFNFPGNVHVFPAHIQKIECNGYSVTGASFPSPSADFSQSIPLAEGETINILCIHGDILTKSDYNPMNKDILASLGYDYIALGHIHNYTKHKQMAYPGCHDGAGFDELGEKGFIFGEIDNEILKTSFIPSSSLIYSVENIDITHFSSSSEIADAICRKFPDGIYRFNLTGTPCDGFIPNTDAIEAFISQKFFYASITDSTSSATDISDGMLYKLFEEYITSHAEGDIAVLALRYGINALKGDLDL